MRIAIWLRRCFDKACVSNSACLKPVKFTFYGNILRHCSRTYTFWSLFTLEANIKTWDVSVPRYGRMYSHSERTCFRIMCLCYQCRSSIVVVLGQPRGSKVQKPIFATWSWEQQHRYRLDRIKMYERSRGRCCYRFSLQISEFLHTIKARPIASLQNLACDFTSKLRSKSVELLLQSSLVSAVFWFLYDSEVWLRKLMCRVLLGGFSRVGNISTIHSPVTVV